MKNKIILLLILLMNSACLYSQNFLKIIIKDSITHENLIGVSAVLAGSNNGASSNENGIVEMTNIPGGVQTIVLKYLGYHEREKTFDFSFTLNQTMEIFMQADDAELKEITIESTRSSRSIENVPTRVETIGLEELEEKTNMRPANVSMVLHESTGIQVQQTSVTTGNASIRMQGLDGRYTQILKDGFPVFSNFASGLSILEIPPLDLKQVEIIKGPSSTLFGAGAIAGVVNFISKAPKEKTECNLIFNQSHVGQSNAAVFVTDKNKKTGFTLLGLVNNQKAFDVDNDDFTELPKAFDFTINPRLFIYLNAKTTIQLGNSFIKSDRTGGDIFVIKSPTDSVHNYIERNNSLRNISIIQIEKKLTDTTRFQLKESFTVFKRKIIVPDYQFSGKNYNSFTELSFSSQTKKHNLIYGINFIYDKFIEDKNLNNITVRDNLNSTSGLYIQDTWDYSTKIKLETGLRVDIAAYQNTIFKKTETFLLPRISILLNFNEKISSRIGSGLGYKTPTLFTERTETLQYRSINQLNNVKSEKSIGGTADINYKTLLSSDFYFSINQMFFYTMINYPLILESGNNSDYYFINVTNPVISSGFETNAKLIWKDYYKLFIGYTFNEVKAKYLNVNQNLELIPQNKINLALIYENPKLFKFGLEGYFTDRQYLSNGTKTPSFWEFGAMIEKLYKKFSFYINAENLTDVKQSNYKRVSNEPHNNPTFDEIWTQTEGFVLSAGIKIRI